MSTLGVCADRTLRERKVADYIRRELSVHVNVPQSLQKTPRRFPITWRKAGKARTLAGVESHLGPVEWVKKNRNSFNVRPLSISTLP